MDKWTGELKPHTCQSSMGVAFSLTKASSIIYATGVCHCMVASLSTQTCNILLCCSMDRRYISCTFTTVFAVPDNHYPTAVGRCSFLEVDRPKRLAIMLLVRRAVLRTLLDRSNPVSCSSGIPCMIPEGDDTSASSLSFGGEDMFSAEPDLRVANEVFAYNVSH